MIVRLPLVDVCPRCNALACRGDWRSCRGADIELAERERQERRDIELNRLRDQRGTL